MLEFGLGSGPRHLASMEVDPERHGAAAERHGTAAERHGAAAERHGAAAERHGAAAEVQMRIEGLAAAAAAAVGEH